MSTRRAFLGGAVAAAAALPLAATAGADPTRRAGQVETVLGPIAGERMGVTAPHEHVLAGSTDILRLWPEYFGGREHFTAAAIARLKAVKAAGIDTIVDCTTADLGRDIPLLQAVSRGSGVQIVATTGHWVTPTPSFEARTADELADFFTLEITRGIEDTGVRPGVIKAASQGDGMTPFQEKVFRAAARASKRTGLPVTTHSDARHRGGEQQAAIFEQEGLDPRRVCIGHSDESGDFTYLAGLARRGYTLGFDHLFYGLAAMGGGSNGSPTWQARAAMIKQLVDAGLGDRIFLANDWMYGLTIAPTGSMAALEAANPDGGLFNVKNTIPHLRQLGVSEAQIRTITVANPRAFFAGG
jgi:phosphotriesterase-related protein